LKFDPYFIDRKVENSMTFEEIIEKSSTFSKNFPQKFSESNKKYETNLQNSDKKLISLNNSNEKNMSLKKTSPGLDNNSGDCSGSELSFEKVCTLPKNETKHLLSSEKRIKEKFSANDSFYQNMIADLNANKTITKEDFDKNEFNMREQENPNNFILKLQEISIDKNGSLMKTNNSFIENMPQRVYSLKKPSNSKEKVAKNFESYDLLTELKKKLKEKEQEIGSSFNAPAGKKIERNLPLQRSPKINKDNEVLIKTATEKVQHFFNSLKQGSKEPVK